MSAVRASRLRKPVLAWIVLGVSLLLTGLAWRFSNQYIHQRAEDRFTYRTKDIEEAIRRRMITYDSTVANPAGDELTLGTFARTAKLKLSGGKWFLRFESKQNFISAAERSQSLIVAIGGVLVNLLLFFIIWQLSDLRKQAVVLAEQMTADLDLANEGLQQEVAERRRAEAEREKVLASVAGANRELEQFNKLAVGRELRMIGLKGEVNELAVATGRQPRYNLSFTESGASVGRQA